MEYMPFGESLVDEHLNSSNSPFRFNAKELDEATGNYYYGARYYNPKWSTWLSVDPLAEEFPSWSPYAYTYNNPINFIDPTGMNGEDWVERANGLIEWDDDVTSSIDPDLEEGETYLGKNVLVGTHNRDENGDEPINSARFDLYLESNKSGPSATIYGNTVPDDATVCEDRLGNSLPEEISEYGTLAEGLYSAEYSYYNGDGALLIGNGEGLPTLNGNQNNLNNYSKGKLKPKFKHVVSEIFFHKGNFARESLHTREGYPISAGCQTGGCGKGSLAKYRNFIKNAEGFYGAYYLRSKPSILPFSSQIEGY